MAEDFRKHEASSAYAAERVAHFSFTRSKAARVAEGVAQISFTKSKSAYAEEAF